jgi:hypothetical protein
MSSFCSLVLAKSEFEIIFAFFEAMVACNSLIQ